MADIVISGQKFKIKGEQPTAQEQLAIDTFLGARNYEDEKTGSSILDNDEFVITPEDVLSEAQKGKYNKDTESFLSSPSFMRIATEVGLSIAGGIAGVAMAPFSGGSSLALTATTAARIARIARPLLNISANTVGKIGRGTLGAAVGGGTGAAVAQAFDPKESIVKEVARGTIQGGFGEVLGFGMAGGLAKIYNKVATGSVNTMRTANAATKVLDRQKIFYSALGKIRSGQITTQGIEELIQANPKLSDIQKATLRSKDQALETLARQEQKLGTDFLGQVEAGSITPAMLTENAMIDQLQAIAEASLFGAGRMRAASGGARIGLVAGIDDLVENAIRGIDQEILDPAAFGTMVQQSLTNSQKLYTRTLTEGFSDIARQLDEAGVVPIRTNGPEKIKLWNPQLGRIEETDSLGVYLSKQLEEMTTSNFPGQYEEAVDLIQRTIGGVRPRATFRELAEVYKGVSRTSIKTPEGSRMQAEILRRTSDLMERADLPGPLRTKRNDLVELTKMGSKSFNQGIFSSIAKKNVGQEKIFDMILKANQKSVTDDFLRQIDATTSAGTRLIPIDEANRIKDGIRGHFFKRFLDDTTRFDNQYTYLDAAKARDFVQNKYSDFIKGGGLISKAQAQAMDEYVEALKYAEGKIFRPGTTGKGRGTIFIQLKEAGAISQLGGAIALGGGYVDPGTAGVFILGPYGLARMFSNPKLMKLVTEGVKGTSTQNIQGYTRFMNQLGTGLVGNNIITDEQNSMVQNTIKANEDQLASILKGNLKALDVVPNEAENPANADSIAIESNQPPPSSDTMTASQLPTVTPSDLPLVSAPQNNNMQLAQTLNLFNKGGIASVRK
jgi:hypothetical protein|tara:strand:+ start:59 stop:2581 length:2523 start_codon:yes stop_codon:yes gene_type:complete